MGERQCCRCTRRGRRWAAIVGAAPSRSLDVDRDGQVRSTEGAPWSIPAPPCSSAPVRSTSASTRARTPSSRSTSWSRPLPPRRRRHRRRRRRARRRRRRAHRVDALAGATATRARSWPSALGASPRHTAYTRHGRQRPAVAREPRVPRHRRRARPTSCCSAAARPGAPACGPARAGDELDWTVQGDDVAAGRAARRRGADDARRASRPAASSCRCRCTRCSSRRSARRRAARSTSTWSRISELWARLQRGRRRQPERLDPARRTRAEEIRTPAPDNRMIGFPYTKLMNSNNSVEQGAAVILCSAERAEALGVPRDRWVFPHAGTDAHDHYFVSDRDDLRASPAMRIGRPRRARAGRASASTTSPTSTSTPASRRRCRSPRDELGPRRLDRPLTVTGGLYVRRRAVEQLRACTRSPRWPSGCASEPGARRARHRQRRLHHQARLRRLRHRAAGRRLPPGPTCRPRSTRRPPGSASRSTTATVTIESWTVMHDRDGAPEAAFASVRTADGARTWALSRDADVLATLLTDDPAGAKATLDLEGTLRF